MFDTIKIGKRIAELRKKKNITQMELAKIVIEMNDEVTCFLPYMDDDDASSFVKEML